MLAIITELRKYGLGIIQHVCTDEEIDDWPVIYIFLIVVVSTYIF